MPRFDIFENEGDSDYLLDVQSDILKSFTALTLD